MKTNALFLFLSLFILICSGRCMGHNKLFENIANSKSCKQVHPNDRGLFINDTIIVISPDYCSGNAAVTLTCNLFSSYLWSTGETTQSIAVNEPGFYTVFVTNLIMCRGFG